MVFVYVKVGLLDDVVALVVAVLVVVTVVVVVVAVVVVALGVDHCCPWS